MISTRFRGFLPVVVDLETGGFNAKTDALLEIAAVLLTMDEDGTLRRGETVSFHVQPFPGANLEPASLQVTGIDPFHPLRPAIPNATPCRMCFARCGRRSRMPAASARSWLHTMPISISAS